jgi:hypothetical protein
MPVARPDCPVPRPGLGRYRLEIGSAAGSALTRLEVVAEPPLWRTPWFIAARWS